MLYLHNVNVVTVSSRVAQWKRAGPITQRSEDLNLALLVFVLSIKMSKDQLLLISLFSTKQFKKNMQLTGLKVLTY